MTQSRFELVFVGGATADYFPRYRRYHSSFESAEKVAGEVMDKLRDDCLPTACHQAIVYGSGCGRDGVTLWESEAIDINNYREPEPDAEPFTVREMILAAIVLVIAYFLYRC